MLKPAQQRQAAKAFFGAELQNLDSATRAVVRQMARQLKTEMLKQLRQNFKHSGGYESKGWQKGVKIYDLEGDLSRGPASYVRLGKIPSQYQEARTVRGKKGNLAILLPEGRKLGFYRINGGNPWQAMWAKWGKFLQLAKVADGMVVLYRHQGRLVPVYKLQKSVTIPKKITFFETAEAISADMAEQINKLMGAGNG
jgi:hypothetical protein